MASFFAMPFQFSAPGPFPRTMFFGSALSYAQLNAPKNMFDELGNLSAELFWRRRAVTAQRDSMTA